MKKLLLIVLLIPFFGRSQEDLVSIKGDTLFMLKTEVSNEMYRDFLNDLSPKEKRENLPDSTKWNYKLSYCEPLINYYFRHPAYKKYPVVNITNKNAVEFCRWKSNVLNNNNFGRKVIVRLPTEKEWEFAAKGKNKYAIYPWGTEKMRVEKGRKKGVLRANFALRKGDFNEDGATITAPINSYFPNDFGLYNMSGNVEEMVSEKGITKGGSWRDRADFLRIDIRQLEDSASPEVGFRYVVEVIEKGNPIKKSFLRKTWDRMFGIKNDKLPRS